MQTVLRWVDTISEWTGKIARWFIIPIVFIIVTEVVLRYVFNRPTLWAWDINIQLQAALVSLGLGYALLHKSHVSVDIIVTRLSPRRNAIIETITGPVLIATVGLLLWRMAPYVLNSIRIRELHGSIWMPPIYPVKVVILTGICLLLLQGIANWIRSLMVAIKFAGKVE